MSIAKEATEFVKQIPQIIDMNIKNGKITKKELQEISRLLGKMEEQVRRITKVLDSSNLR